MGTKWFNEVYGFLTFNKLIEFCLIFPSLQLSPDLLHPLISSRGHATLELAVSVRRSVTSSKSERFLIHCPFPPICDWGLKYTAMFFHLIRWYFFPSSFLVYTASFGATPSTPTLPNISFISWNSVHLRVFYPLQSLTCNLFSGPVSFTHDCHR